MREKNCGKVFVSFKSCGYILVREGRNLLLFGELFYLGYRRSFLFLWIYKLFSFVSIWCGRNIVYYLMYWVVLSKLEFNDCKNSMVLF